MSKESWTNIRQSNHFYVNTYRRGATILLLSVFLNIGLGVAIYYVYTARPEHDFYATDGVTPPVPLVPMDHSNESTSALLADEQNTNDNTRAVPR